MKKLIDIEPIAVKDKNDVVKALTILEKLGIKYMTDTQKNDYLADEKKIIDDDFMIQEDGGGFRIQSHYIGVGISLDNLEKQTNIIIEKYPNICEALSEISELTIKLDNKIKVFPTLELKEEEDY